MASKSSASAALFLCLNLIIFAFATAQTTCSVNTLSLNVCADLAGINVVVGNPPYPCCTLIAGLANLEAATCLCLAVEANILNILNLTADVAIAAILNNCQISYPTNYHCAL